MFLALMIVFLTIFITFYLFLSSKNNYWKKRGVISPQAKVLFGNYEDFFLMRKSFGENAEHLCNQFPDEPLIGVYYGTEPALIVKDPEFIKTVMTKDFYYFSGRDLDEHAHRETITRNLFNAGGDYWKVIRQNLTPMFTSTRMKQMFVLIEDCTKVFDKLLDEEIKKEQIHEIRFLSARYTMDCIGSCAFGINTEVMGKDIKNNPFRRIADTIFDISIPRTLRIYLRTLWPNIFYSMGLQLFPKEVEKFFWSLMSDVFDKRSHKPSQRNDLVDAMLAFKENQCIKGDRLVNMKTKEDKQKISLEIDNDLLIAQCVTFFAAGFETSSTTMSFTMYELAKHKDIQRRVIEEVKEYLSKRNGVIQYDCVSELPYLNACIDEALRLYPVVGIITRETVEEYTFDNGVKVDKNIRVQLPTFYMHKNPKYFPEPEKYIPERFLIENKGDVIPYSYFPFGEGPRLCIGMRFAKMQMLAGMATIFKNYQLELAPGMAETIQYEPKSIVTRSKYGVYLKITKQ